MHLRRCVSVVFIGLSAGCTRDAGVGSAVGSAGRPAQVAAPKVAQVKPTGAQPRWIFEKMPVSVRDLRFSMSQIDTATLIRSSTSDKAVVEDLGAFLAPGRKIDGWICKVHWAILRELGGSDRYSYYGLPPMYEFVFEFPEDLRDHKVWLWGHNFVFAEPKYTVANEALRDVGEGDWVRIDGVIRAGSAVQWNLAPKLGPDLLSIGEVTVTHIAKLDAKTDADHLHGNADPESPGKNPVINPPANQR